MARSWTSLPTISLIYFVLMWNRILISAQNAICDSPTEVIDAFETGTDCLVDTCIYSTVSSGIAAPTNLTRPSSASAWVSGYNTIELFLEARASGQTKQEAAETLLTSLGLTEPFIREPYILHIFNGCIYEDELDAPVRVPTAAEWLRTLGNEYNIRVPEEVGRDFILSGMNFESYTNCTNALCVVNRSFPTNNTCGCNTEFRNAVERFGEVAWVEGGNTTECFSLLKETPEIDIIELRAALLVCDSANAFNTFNGLAFNGTEYTQPEFVVPNIGFEELQEAGVPYDNTVLIGDPEDATPVIAQLPPEGGGGEMSIRDVSGVGGVRMMAATVFTLGLLMV